MGQVGLSSGIFPGEVRSMFESQYNDEMEAEVRRLEGKQRAIAAGHPEWDNACAGCGCELPVNAAICWVCGTKW